MTAINVVILDDIDGGSLGIIKNGFPRDNVVYVPDNSADIESEIKGAHILIFRSNTQITEEGIIKKGTVEVDIKDCRNLEVLARQGVGTDNVKVDLSRYRSRGICLVNTPTATSIDVAELVIGYIIALSRNIVQADRSMREGRWNKKVFTREQIGIRIADKKLGILGFGNIGREVAERAHGLRMNVLGYDIVQKKKVRGVIFVGLDELLASADFVTVHIPLTRATEGLVNKVTFRAMKTTAYLIHTSRGGVVDEGDLVNALRNEEIAGAALDVYATEGYPENGPLRSIENTILTPHIAGSTVEGQHASASELVERIKEVRIDRLAGLRRGWSGNPKAVATVVDRSCTSLIRAGR